MVRWWGCKIENTRNIPQQQITTKRHTQREIENVSTSLGEGSCLAGHANLCLTRIRYISGELQHSWSGCNYNKCRFLLFCQCLVGQRAERNACSRSLLGILFPKYVHDDQFIKSYSPCNVFLFRRQWSSHSHGQCCTPLSSICNSHPFVDTSGIWSCVVATLLQLLPNHKAYIYIYRFGVHNDHFVLWKILLWSSKETGWKIVPNVWSIDHEAILYPSKRWFCLSGLWQDTF